MTTQQMFNERMTNPINWIDLIKLEFFEQVIGRKFTCGDCPYLKNYSPYSHCCKYFSFNRFNLHGLKPCKHFKLSKDIMEIIKLKDEEIEDTKIDTHPRFNIQWFDDETFDVIVMMNLELIL